MEITLKIKWPYSDDYNMCIIQQYVHIWVHIQRLPQNKNENRNQVYLDPFFFVLLRTKTNNNEKLKWIKRTLMSYTWCIQLYLC